MPCSNQGTYPHVQTIYSEGPDPSDKIVIKRLRVELAEAKTRNDFLADLLCKTGRARANKTDIPADVLSWWDEHCKFDRQRGEPW